MANKINEVRKRGTELSYKRYSGEKINIKTIELFEEISPYIEREFEEYNYFKNFTMAGDPLNKEILIAEKLLKELEEEAIKKDVGLSTLISVYLLEMLERNKPTRIFGKGKTKGKSIYISNNLYENSNFIKYVESKEKVEENIFSNRKLEEALTYENRAFDEYIYIQNYLINKGYSEEQIQELQKEELEKCGTFESDGIKMMKPYKVDMEHYFEYKGKKIEALSFDYSVIVYIPARLGFHYVLMQKKDSPKTYEGIEELINKGGYKVWDLYAKFLEMESQKKTNLQKVE